MKKEKKPDYFWISPIKKLTYSQVTTAVKTPKKNQEILKLKDIDEMVAQNHKIMIGMNLRNSGKFIGQDQCTKMNEIYHDFLVDAAKKEVSKDFAAKQIELHNLKMEDEYNCYAHGKDYKAKFSKERRERVNMGFIVLLKKLKTNQKRKIATLF